MKLSDAFQRFVVEEARDTKRSIRRMAPAPTIARPKLKERVELWWVQRGVTARIEVMSARLRRLHQLVRK